jgi:hypothetical protein
MCDNSDKFHIMTGKESYDVYVNDNHDDPISDDDTKDAPEVTYPNDTWCFLVGY